MLSPVLVLALLVAWSAKTSPGTPTPAITNSTNTPTEIAPKKETYQWTGSADEPRYIVLPSIAAEGFVQKADVDQNNEIAVPSNIHMAAWFLKSAKPGMPGLSIIDGHVNGRENAGIFKNLSKLKNGDVYTVELGNGSLKKYKVFKNETVPLADSVNILFSQNPKVQSQLNLITCGGTFDSKTQSYDKRVIISSTLQ